MNKRAIVGLLGLSLMTFTAVVLTGPGRIDIVDGDARYEVAKSLVEHGDSQMRNPRIWWSKFPSANGGKLAEQWTDDDEVQLWWAKHREEVGHSYYRLPPSLFGMLGIWASDLSGVIDENRRKFCFTAVGGLVAVVVVVGYYAGFRARGLSVRGALAASAVGMFALPTWYYATSTFDEIYGVAAVIGATSAALHRRFVVSALFMGFAYHCKQPLAAFLPLVLAFQDDVSRSLRRRLFVASVTTFGLLMGAVTEKWYDDAKFPFDKHAVHQKMREDIYGPVYANHQITALTALIVSPSCSVFLYAPPIVLGFVGIVTRRRAERWPILGFALGSLAFIGFFCSFSFFKGDPAWGPRYFTPWLALIWWWGPDGYRLLVPALGKCLILLGVGVQLLALMADPHRLYLEHGVNMNVYVIYPAGYFRYQEAHLLQRPGEIYNILTDPTPPEAFTPNYDPAHGIRDIDSPMIYGKLGPEVVRRYRVLQSFRPWWACMSWLPSDERPVPLVPTALTLLAGLLGGAGLFRFGLQTDNPLAQKGHGERIDPIAR